VNFQYHDDYFPPAPFVDVSFITVAESLRIGPLPGFVDSGADGTIVPVAYLEEIHAPPTVEKTIRSQWGERRTVILYYIHIVTEQ